MQERTELILFHFAESQQSYYTPNRRFFYKQTLNVVTVAELRQNGLKEPSWGISNTVIRKYGNSKILKLLGKDLLIRNIIRNY